MQKNEIGPYTKINSKWIRELNIRPETIKLLKGNIGEKLHDSGFGDNFMTPKSQATNAKMDYIKLESFCKAKQTVKRGRGRLGNRRKCLQTVCLIRGNFPKHIRNTFNSIAN